MEIDVDGGATNDEIPGSAVLDRDSEEIPTSQIQLGKLDRTAAFFCDSGDCFCWRIRIWLNLKGIHLSRCYTILSFAN